MRTCSSCKEELHHTEFAKNQKYCRPCKSRKHKEYRQEPVGAYNTIKAGARNRGIDFDISMAKFMELWKAECHYCGYPIHTIGIDRIDSSRGYLDDNIVSCCRWCNSGKSDRSPEEYIKLCIRVAQRHGGQEKGPTSV